MKELELGFEGIGEVKGFKFAQMQSSTYAYLYEVVGDGGNVHYEIFERKNTPICIDFEKRIYSDTEFKEVYPKAKDFGIWAFTVKNFDSALIEFNYLHGKGIDKLNKQNLHP
jgi:hypothetical protein